MVVHVPQYVYFDCLPIRDVIRVFFVADGGTAGDEVPCRLPLIFLLRVVFIVVGMEPILSRSAPTPPSPTLRPTLFRPFLRTAAATTTPDNGRDERGNHKRDKSMTQYMIKQGKQGM